MRRIASIVLLSVALSACATSGSGKINWNNARQLKAGMSQQEVKGLLGDPYMVKTIGKDEVRWVWVNVNVGLLSNGSESAAVTFKDGKLVEAPQIPDSFK